MKISRSLAGLALLVTLGMSLADAADGVTDLGHISVSVNDPIDIHEVSPMRFGNITVATAGTGDANVVLDVNGGRSVTGANTDGLTLLHGAANSTNNADDAGAQAEGVYSLHSPTPSTVIYISFSEAGTGNLIDSIHPANHAVVGTAPNNFKLDTLTFAGSNGGGTDPVFGQYVNVDGSGDATVSVGGTLHTVAGAAYAEGRYTGTFNIMASY